MRNLMMFLELNQAENVVGNLEGITSCWDNVEEFGVWERMFTINLNSTWSTNVNTVWKGWLAFDDTRIVFCWFEWKSLKNFKRGFMIS